ncbi:MAG: cation transporter [Tannerellaceae bacterium]
MQRSLYKIDKMDCPCEEGLIRMKLQEINDIAKLDFNLSQRTLMVFHHDSNLQITNALNALNLGSHLIETTEGEPEYKEDDTKQRSVLRAVLLINLIFFIIEITTGYISNSMGLVADSLDMLADALVYGMSLIVVGAIAKKKKRVALWSGILQVILAIQGFAEVIKRFIGVEAMPDFKIMIGVSMAALVANAICLWLLQRTQSNDAHMKASVIFSANDVIINLGVIIAGVLVYITQSGIPDLITGIIIFMVVLRGAIRILKLAK